MKTPEERELAKRLFKESTPEMGVFQVKNLANGKIFVKSNRNVHSKINATRFELKMGTHFNKELQQDWLRDGEDNFAFEVLEVLDLKEAKEKKSSLKDQLEKLEAKWIDELHPFGEAGYN